MISNSFGPNAPTMSVAFSSKVVSVDDAKVKLDIGDTAGQ
jgi:hypothetical protein